MMKAQIENMIKEILKMKKDDEKMKNHIKQIKYDNDRLNK